MNEGMHVLPQARVAFDADRPNADRLVELGVARRLDVDATPDELRVAVTALESSPEVTARG